MLILASQSAARKSLLAGAGLRFETSPAQIDERAVEADVLGKGAGPVEVSRKLAEAKALAVSANRAGAVVVGADQVLAVSGQAGDRIFHKAASMVAAAAQLNELKGRTHQLHSGVALVRDGTVLWSAVETASLTMRHISDAERDRVLAQEGEAVLGSVGAYRLEGPSVKLFERIEGDYFTILGLPLLPLLAALRLHAPALME
ncbi:MAG: Maf family protein [Devosia sp.]